METITQRPHFIRIQDVILPTMHIKSLFKSGEKNIKVESNDGLFVYGYENSTIRDNEFYAIERKLC